ncbi:hypothetical protein [Streptomyces sp. NPDC088910]|uniref:hypothetical protein n=1 Tax=Streptomyces sp. NPDC088910 TaxID=3365911 RepID=UPI0037F3A36A
MPPKDELAKRRYDKLVDRVETLVRASLNPEYRGYGGQLILNAKNIEELGGSPDEIRRAARDRRSGRLPGPRRLTQGCPATPHGHTA